MLYDLDTLGCVTAQAARMIGFPPCPAVLARIVSETNKEEPDFDAIGRAISSDVSLAATLLKTVNSPFYGLRTKEHSIQQALIVMGLRNVTYLLAGLLLRQVFASVADSRMEQFWEYSSSIARMSACLARHVEGVEWDVAYTFALFRECGVPAMMGGFADYEPEYSRAELPDGELVTEAEERDFGLHHAYMGYHLAKEWLLPARISRAVLWHHDYPALKGGGVNVSKPSTRLIAIALAAEREYRRHAAMPCAEWDRYCDYALVQLGLDQPEVDALTHRNLPKRSRSARSIGAAVSSSTA